MKTSEQTSQVHPIQIIHTDDLQNSVACFYEKYAQEPVIVKGLFTDNAFLQALNREKGEALFRRQTPLNLTKSRFSSGAGYQRTQAALARCTAWENRSNG